MPASSPTPSSSPSPSAAPSPSPSPPSLTLRDCLFRDNIALHSGGAVYCGTTAAGPPPRFTAIRCLFLDNHSLNGGAIVLENCDTSRISASRFSGNLVLTDGRDSHGGALRILSSPLLLDSCLFVGNKARVSDSDILAFVKCYGGALSAQQSCLSLRNTTFSHNLAEAPAVAPSTSKAPPRTPPSSPAAPSPAATP